MQKFWSKWNGLVTLAAVIAAGLFAFSFLPLKAFKEVTQELIALFGLMMAGVLPTMVLTASALRAGNLSVKRLILYRNALRKQMTVWIGLFLISLVSSLLVIIGKMLDWSLPIHLHWDFVGFTILSFDAMRAINALIVMALAIVVLRAIAVGNGILSLLRLSAELAISEAQAKEDVRHQKTEGVINEMTEREGFGEYVKLNY